jgi:hypothetical protein
VIEEYKKAIEYLIKDLSLKEPVLVNCIFNTEELLKNAGIEIDNDKKIFFAESLHKMHVISKSNKNSDFGGYYNVSRRLYRRFRKNKADKKWIGLDKDLSSGFCILNTSIDNIRMMCNGSECKFFLTTENICIKNKVFL